VKKSKEVQGLLYKVAELETLLIVLIGILGNNGAITEEEARTIFEMADIPEILGARIKRIEEHGVHLVEARKKLLSEMLGVDTPTDGDIFNTGEPIIEGALDDVGREEAAKGPTKKLH